MTASSCQLFFYIFCHFIFLRINTAIVLHSFTFNRHKVSTFQKAKKAETCAFQKCTVLSFLIQKRRKRDLNPRAAINDLLPFQGSPFGQLGYFSKLPYTIVFRFVLPEAFYIISCRFLFVKNFFNFFCKFFILNKRREWDSNPRALADKRFSRPPRYDHFDISPFISCLLFSALQKARIILTPVFLFVNYNFTFFSTFIKSFL